MTPGLIKQEDKPLFPNILWNRPLNRAQGGRILIVGGQRSGFNECQAIYQIALAAGAGECQIALPDSLAKTIGPMGIGHFVPSSPSGSLGRLALGELLALAGDYDAVIIAGNLTNNSETAVLIQSFIEKYQSKIILGQEVLEILKLEPTKITQRTNTLIVCTHMDLFRWANTLEVPIPIGQWDNILRKLEASKTILQSGKAEYAIYNGQIFIPGVNRSSSTIMPWSLSELPSAAIAALGVFWLQNPGKSFEALTTGAYVLQRAALVSNKPLTYQEISRIIPKILDQEIF